MERSKICITGDPIGRDRENEREAIFTEIRAKYFPEPRCNHQNVCQTGEKKKVTLDTCSKTVGCHTEKKILRLFFFFFFFLVFLGPHPQHMEVPRLGVELEL